jgi:hypothetical protein
MKKKHREFLRNIAEGMTNAEAYLSAGYKSKSMISASASARNLLHKLTENIPHRELSAILHTPLEIYSRIKELAEQGAGPVAISALALETKCNGMQDSPQDFNRGVPIIIVNQLPLVHDPGSLNPLDTIEVFPIERPKQLTE